MEKKPLFIFLLEESNEYHKVYGMDRTHIEVSTSIEDWKKENYGYWLDYEVNEDVYQLTEEGEQLLSQWEKDTDHDFMTGEAVEFCKEGAGREYDIWRYLTIREHLAKKVEEPILF